jgi:hypothetical protein
MIQGSKFAKFIAAALVALFASAALADDIRTERVQFKPGATSAVIEDSITGYQTVDYVLGAREGQSMNVSMATNNGANYFNILAPGETEVAMFIGSTSGNKYEGVLPESGDYTIRVYMMRSAARRNEVANYRLETIVAAGGDAASNSAHRAGQGDFDASGNIPCSMGGGAPTGSCPFGVTREGGGSGMVTVTKPDGRSRVIFFENGTATGSDTSQADPGEFRAEKESDMSIIYIGEERYEIPDAVMFGG